MKKNDILCLVLLERRLFPLPWNEGDFEEEICSGTSFCRVVEGEEGILAYACSRQVPDGFELLRIATSPNFERRGFAGILLEEIIFRARKAVYSDIFLEVAVSNEKALALYHKHGFVPYGIRKAYYPGGVDARNLVKKYNPDSR